jgi:hypothetical protein
METTTQSRDSSTTSLQAQKAHLERAKEQLKTEFSGLDDVINQVIDLVSSWYCFPEIQEKPVVINLWGMTGTGKSSLVNRLTELISFKDAHYRFDMGEVTDSPGSMNIYNQLRDTDFREPGEPFVISLDEFQHARTIEENGREVVKPKERIIWQLLDDGTFEMDQGKEKEHKKLQEMCDMLRDAVREEVIVRDGHIEQNKGGWENIIAKHLAFGVGGFFKLDKDEILEELQQSYPPLLASVMMERLYQVPNHGYETVMMLERHLKSLNTQETLDLLIKLKQRALQPTKVDCSKALIFVIGNLDEAYPMHRNSSPDIDADYLHKASQKIGITQIKEALQARFRSEEIARLGNNHVIYPVLRKADFREIIRQALDQVKSKFLEQTGLAIQVDASFEDLIFEEGVYPAQGARPVFTTVYQRFYPLITDVLLSHEWGTDSIETVCLVHQPPQIQAWVYPKHGVNGKSKGEPVIVSRDQPLMLNDKRTSRKDDLQAITAAHEAGHAIAAIFLQQLMPEMICSVSANAGQTGFTHVEQEHRFLSREILKNRIAAKLGGYAAELRVFGEEHMTSGSSNDIEQATEWLARMLRECGLGPLPGHFAKAGPALNNSIRDEGELDQEIRQWLESCLERVQAVLNEQDGLLYEMARYLADHPRMEKCVIRDYCNRFGNGFDPEMIRENGDDGFYRGKVMGV